MDIQSSNLSGVNHDIVLSNDRASEQSDGDSDGSDTLSLIHSPMATVFTVVAMEEEASTLTRLAVTTVLTMVSTALTVVFVTMEE